LIASPIRYEKGVLELQLQMEESFLRIAASTGQPTVLIMERGLLDLPAYLPTKQWRQVLDLPCLALPCLAYPTKAMAPST
jgi:thioredoxin-related protein